MTSTWDTKWGSRRVRHDPPTLAEALIAAQGVTDDLQGQIAIAAELMGVTAAEAKAELMRLAPDRRPTRLVAAPTRDRGTTRTVVVERKTSRRVLAKESPMRSRPAGSDRPER
jgi:hypothetical protein